MTMLADMTLKETVSFTPPYDLKSCGISRSASAAPPAKSCSLMNVPFSPVGVATM
jgi:hypothetical protein